MGFYGIPHGPYLILPALGPSNLRDTTGQVMDLGVERQVDYAEASGGFGVTALRLIDIRHTTSLRYGQLNSPFEYEKVRYVYTRARDCKSRTDRYESQNFRQASRTATAAMLQPKHNGKKLSDGFQEEQIKKRPTDKGAMSSMGRK